MRLNAHDNNPLARAAIILLDGKKLDMCIEADDERGYADVYAKLDDGRYTTLLTHRLFGKVEILDSRTMTPERKFELNVKD